MGEPFIGEIKLFPWNWAPKNWAFCDGRLLPISQNTALFSLLGTTYGGDGRVTFGLPNLQSRTPAHRGSQLTQGELTGVEQVTITTATMAAHNHPLMGTSATASLRAPADHSFGNDTSPSADFYAPASQTIPINPQSIGNNFGGGQPHNNMQPYLVMNYCIALFGIFPSRN